MGLIEVNPLLDIVPQEKVVPGENVRRWLAECRAKGIVPKAREILTQIATDETLSIAMIKGAARELIQYETPKLSAVANLNTNGFDFVDELEKRRAARNGRLIESRPQVDSQVGPIGKSAAQVSSEHQAKGYPVADPMLRRRPI